MDEGKEENNLKKWRGSGDGAGKEGRVKEGKHKTIKLYIISGVHVIHYNGSILT